MKKEVIVTDFVCNNCGKEYYNYKRNDDISITAEMIEGGWLVKNDDECYCPECKNINTICELLFHFPNVYRAAYIPRVIENRGNFKPISFVGFNKDEQFDGELRIGISNEYKGKSVDEFLHMCVNWDDSLSRSDKVSKRIVFTEYDDNGNFVQSNEFLECLCSSVECLDVVTIYHFYYQYTRKIDENTLNEYKK